MFCNSLYVLAQGMLRARGSVLLFADADGASKFEDYAKLENSIKQITSGIKFTLLAVKKCI